MPGRTFHIFNPQDNPYRGRPHKSPPEFYDGREGKPPSVPLRAMLARQHASGAFDWDTLLIGASRHEFDRGKCAKLLRRSAPAHAVITDEVLSTASVLVVFRTTYRHNESHHYHEADRAALKWLSGRAKLDEATLDVWINLACQTPMAAEAQIADTWKEYFTARNGMAKSTPLTKLRYADCLYEKRRGVWVDVQLGRVVTPPLARHLDELAAAGGQQ